MKKLGDFFESWTFIGLCALGILIHAASGTDWFKSIVSFVGGVL